MSRTRRKIEIKNAYKKWMRSMEHKHFRQITRMRIRAGHELLPQRKREYKARWELCGYREEYQKEAPQEE